MNWDPPTFLCNQENQPRLYNWAQIWLSKASLTRAKKRALFLGRDFQVTVTAELLQPIPADISPWAASIAPFSPELIEAATQLIKRRFNSKHLQVTGPVKLRPAGVIWGKDRFMLADFDVV